MIMKPTSSLHHSSLRQRGFTLIELSMVLIVIAIIIGAVAVGSDVQRNAAYQKLGSSFVRGWQLAYMSYKSKIGVVLADSQTTPTGYVNADTSGTGQEVCATPLRALMLQAGVEMPQGRTEGKEYLYSYQDSNGNPQEAEVCFRAFNWMVETSTPGSYTNQVKNVMVIKGVTPDLARMIYSMADTARDAQFGKVRQYPEYYSGSGNYSPAMTSGGSFSPSAKEYSLTNKCVYGSGDCTQALDEAQVAVMTIYYLMD